MDWQVLAALAIGCTAVAGYLMMGYGSKKSAAEAPPQSHKLEAPGPLAATDAATRTLSAPPATKATDETIARFIAALREPQ